MKKTLVCLISAQALPNYLFIKEMYLPGDDILLISSKGSMEQNAYNLEKSLSWNKNTKIVTHVFSKEGVENSFVSLSEEISSCLNSGCQYFANLTGGTKLMALALYKQLEKFPQSQIYYMPFPRMTFAQIAPNIAELPVTAAVSIKDFFAMHGRVFHHAKRGCFASSEMADKFFKIFTSKEKNELVVSGFEYLRKIRSQFDEEKRKAGKKYVEKPITINSGASPALDFFEYTPLIKDHLCRDESQYLTGGWFEEWTYYTIKSHLGLDTDTIAMNPHVFSRNNELDVVFVYHNELYIIECKSGIPEGGFNKVLDTINSIKTQAKGLSIHSTLFLAVSAQSNNWEKNARELGIGFLDKDALLDADKMFSFIND